ncbi:hypothetical protein [Methylomagnum sp.]
MEQEAAQINVNDLIPVGAWGVGAIHGQTPAGPTSYVVMAPRVEQDEGEDVPSLQPLVMTVELAEQLIKMLSHQVGMIKANDPFGGLPPAPLVM